MRRVVLVLFFIFIARFVQAQYVPNSGQAFQFYSMFNPAFSGIDPFTTVRLGYGYRWAGFAGAPKSINLSYNTRIIKPLDLSTNSLRLSNFSAVRIPKSRQVAVGFGMNVFQTTYGPVETVGGSVNLSMHYPLSKKVKIAAGLTMLVENTKFDLTKIVFRNDDEEKNTPYYRSLVANGSSKASLNLRGGFLIYAPKFYLGFSYFPIFETSIQNASIDQSNPSVYSGSVQAGYSIEFSPDFTMKPSVSGLLIANGGVNLDYNVKAYIQKSSWVGVSYRDIKAAVISVGFNISYLLTASYSYERSFGKFRTFNDGSHELILSLRLNNFKKQAPYTW